MNKTPKYIRVAGVVYKKAVVVTVPELVQNLYITIDMALFGGGSEEGTSFQEVIDYLEQSNDVNHATELSAIMQKYMDVQKELAAFSQKLAGA